MNQGFFFKKKKEYSLYNGLFTTLIMIFQSYEEVSVYIAVAGLLWYAITLAFPLLNDYVRYVSNIFIDS